MVGFTPDGCRAKATFLLSDSDQQYGSAPGIPATCGMGNSTFDQFFPVMFWYFLAAQNQSRAVICRPTLQVFNAEVTLDLTNFQLSNVTLIDSYTKPNNVSGGELNGRAFNACVAV